jgi:uncharacterized membrane protein YdjX (TVP38/TMEM64 family)
MLVDIINMLRWLLLLPLNQLGATFIAGLGYDHYYSRNLLLGPAMEGCACFLYLFFAMSLVPSHKLLCGTILAIAGYFFMGFFLHSNAYLLSHMLGAALAAWAKRSSLRHTKFSRRITDLAASDTGERRLSR